MDESVRSNLRRVGLAVVAIGLVASIPGAISAQESAEEGSAAAEEVEWDWSARIRPRLEGRFNHHFGLEPGELNYPTAFDDSDAFTQQSRLGVNAERGDLSAHFTLQHTATWGDFSAAGLELPPLFLYQARLRYEPHDAVFVDVGRFELAYGDQRVLGSVGWSQAGRTWDGLRVGVEPIDDLAIDAFAGRYIQSPDGFLDGDAYLTGIYATLSDPVDDIIDEIDVYALYDLRWGEPEVLARRQILMFGGRVAAELQGFDATVEGGYQTGLLCDTEEDVSGCAGPRSAIGAYFFDSEAGVTVAGFRPFVGFSVASGDDPESESIEAYDQLYPTGHAWLGYMDIIGPRTNIREVRGGLQWEYEWFRHEIVVHDFARLQPTSERVGLEIDTKLYFEIADGLTAAAGHGLFIPDDGISSTDNAPEGVANWSFVQVVGTF